jgi:uncharacterized protein
MIDKFYSLDFYGLGEQFLKQTVNDLTSMGLLSFASQIDHVCYRVASLERYEECKNQFVKMGTLLAETSVNGRPIATYRLKNPLQAMGEYEKKFEVFVVEIPAPKPNTHYPEGFEHVEIVVADLSKMEALLKQKSIIFEFSEAKNDVLQIAMAEIKVKLNKASVKFHLLSLENIIAQEIKAEKRR